MNRDFQRPPPLAGQADLLASKGRFGDTMLVHMNPTEVDVLRQMTPGGQLTINPDTGQPEAFLPLLLGLGGALVGGAATTGILASLGSLGLGAIGTGLGTTIETGSLKEGLKAGLISGLVGGVAGRLLSPAAAAGAESVTGSAGGAAASGAGSEALKTVTSEIAKEGVKNVAVPLGTEASRQGASLLAKDQIGQQLATNVGSAVGGVAPQASGGAFGALGNVGPILSQPDFLKVASEGVGAGLTGQAMTDQFNLMNQPMGPGLDEDAEEFYVPVTADDRGLQFPGSRQGSSEFDYFANPFSFTEQPTQDSLTPVPSFKDGGMIDRAPRKFDVGGEIAADAPPPPNRSDYGGSTRMVQAYNKAVDRYEAQYGPVESYGKSVPMPITTTIPSYFTSNNPNQAAESVGDDLDDMITEQVRQRVYTPRRNMMPSTTMGNIRGAGDVDFTDYNRRLLGAPTRMIDVTRPMTEAEITARDEAAAAEAAAAEAAAAEAAAAEAAAATSATSGIPQSVLNVLPPGMDLSRVPPAVRAQILAGLDESISVGGEAGAYGGAPVDPYAAARAAGRTNATPTPETPSYTGMMGNTIDPYQNYLEKQGVFDPNMPASDFSVPGDMGVGSDGMMDMMGGEGMGMGNVIPFNPVPPVGAASAPAVGVAPVPAIPPISAGVNTPAFDPLAGVDFRGGRGGFEFSGPGGMYIGM